MSERSKNAIKTLKPGKIWIPAGISIGYVVYLLFTDENFKPDKLKLIVTAGWFPLALTFLLLVIKEVSYIYRIKYLSENQLSLKASTQIILLWEFASAVTPFVVGGTPVAIFLFLKEKINLGKSIAFAMVTAIFDNIYLLIFLPVIYLVFQGHLFDYSSEGLFSESLSYILLFSYLMVMFYTVIMSFAIFIRPRLFKWVLLKITAISFLRRWRMDAYQHGKEIMLASKELRGKGFSFWWKIFFTTVSSWTARFVMINFLIMAFVDIDLFQHTLSFGRHIALWVITLVSPTPGGAMAAEGGFNVFFQDLIGNYTGAITILWRAYSYYIFLIVGIIVLPRWLNRVFKKPSLSDDKPVEPVV